MKALLKSAGTKLHERLMDSLVRDLEKEAPRP